MNRRIKTTSLFLVVAISAWSTHVEIFSPTFTLAGLLSVSFLAYIWLSDGSEMVVLVFVLVTFVTAAVLTTLNGVLHGWDSWLYVASSRLIEARGWVPDASKNTNVHLFPGIQFMTVLLGKVTGMEVVSVAKYLPVLLKVLPILFSYLIAREVIVDRRQALLAPILLVSFTPFIAWLPYHHLTYGFVLTLGVLYVVLLTIIECDGDPCYRRRMFMVVSILLISLLISHQLSMFKVMVLIGVTIGVYTGGHLLVERQLRIPTPLVALLAIFFSTSLLYYFWVAPRYFSHVLALQMTFSSTVPSASNFPIEQTLERIYIGGGSSSSLEYWTSRRGYINQIAILMFGFSAIVALYNFCRRTVFRWQPEELDIPTYVAFSYVGTYGALRVMSTLGIGRFGGTRRLVLYSLPFAIAGVLALKVSEGWDSIAFRTGAIAIVVLSLLLSTAIFPGYLFTESGVPSEDGDYLNQIFLTPERQTTYEWTRFGSHAAVDSQGMLYINGMVRTTRTHVRQRVFAGDYDAVPEGTLFVITDGQKRKLPIRSHPYEYRIPEEVYSRYQESSELHRVYDSGRSSIYRINGEPTQ